MPEARFDDTTVETQKEKETGCQLPPHFTQSTKFRSPRTCGFTTTTVHALLEEISQLGSAALAREIIVSAMTALVSISKDANHARSL